MAQRCLIHILPVLYFSDIKSSPSPFFQPGGSCHSPCHNFTIRKNMITSSETMGKGLFCFLCSLCKLAIPSPLILNWFCFTSSALLPKDGISATHCPSPSACTLPAHQVLALDGDAGISLWSKTLINHQACAGVTGIPMSSKKIIPAPAMWPSAPSVEGE